ncbi:MAG: YibE/F family protein [Acidimicrobiia bacterium]|nr:YibE/F family protein [Acidimicrobiia bacterium]
MESDSEQAGDPAELEEWLEYGTDWEPSARRRPEALVLAAVLLGLATIVGLVALWPSGDYRQPAEELSALGVPSEFYGADVVSVVTGPCRGLPTVECTTVDFELTAGPNEGYILEQEFGDSPTTPDFRAGQRAVLSYIGPNAVVRDASDRPCSIDDTQTCRVLSLVLDGTDDPQYLEYELFPGESGAEFFLGAPVIAEFFEGEGGEFEVFSVSGLSPRRQYQFADFQRRGTLFWLALGFGLVVVALGGWRGAAALAGLVASVAVLLVFVLPAILEGRSPVLVAVIGAACIAFLALYMAHGFSRMTTVALIGTLAALILTALLSAFVVGIAEFTGLVSEESSLLTLFEGIDVRGLLLAGIVLGAAGAIDDVTVTQASAVWELKAASPNLGKGELFRRGLRIGRDHIASTVNTLLLAYAGAALPLLVLFVLSEQSLGTVANSEVVSVEIVRTLVGSIGLVAAVPFTTWLAAVVADTPEPAVPAEA